MRQKGDQTCQALVLSAAALWLLLMLGCSVPTSAPTAPTAIPATGPRQAEGLPTAHPPVSAAPWQETAPRLTAALRERGYTVQAGEFRFFQIHDCLAMPSCVGNNPTSPYGMYCLPPAPGDTPARAAEPPCPREGNLRWVWRLREDEALVFLGKTPPRSRYFSFRSYLFSRAGWFRHRELFASLGDALHLLDIATAGSPNGAGGDPFAQETVVISTADRRIDTLLRQLLSHSGAPEAIVNTDVIPRAITHMGLDDEASDRFAMLVRVALFADRAAGEHYQQAPPATVLRVTPPTPVAIDPFPVPPQRPRGTNSSEAWLRPALDELVAAVKAHYHNLEVKTRRTFVLDLSGRRCIERGTLCLGDNADTTYIASIPTWLSDRPQDFLIVVGVNHQATGKASYMNLAVYHVKRLMGIGAVTGDDLAGSADRYLPNHPLRRYLYAYKFARNCQGEADCFPVPTEEIGVPLDDALNFIERPYLELATRTGPLSSQILIRKFYASARRSPCLVVAIPNRCGHMARRPTVWPELLARGAPPRIHSCR